MRKNVMRGMGLKALRLGVAAAAVMVATSSLADEIRYPKDKPVVTLDVPAGWSVESTPIGLEMRPPEKNAAVVGQIVKGDKASINAWAKKATERMMAWGVSFDAAEAAKPAVAAPTPPAPPSKSAAKAPAPASTASMAPSFSMFGAPTAAGPNMDTVRGIAEMPKSGASGGARRINGLDFKVAQYAGTKLGGVPVDVQLLIIRISDDEVFLIEQASGADDGRTVGIVTSTRSIL